MLLALFLPWLSFIVRGKILSGLFCLILQCTLIGWLPATLWAINSRSNAKTNRKLNELQKQININQK